MNVLLFVERMFRAYLRGSDARPVPQQGGDCGPTGTLGAEPRVPTCYGLYTLYYLEWGCSNF